MPLNAPAEKLRTLNAVPEALRNVSNAVAVLLGGYNAGRLKAGWTCCCTVGIGVKMLLGTPFVYKTVEAESLSVFMLCLFVASFLPTCYHGRATAVIHDRTPPRTHSFAFGLYLFVIHLFGDMITPALVGRVSDESELRYGLELGVAANFVSAVCFPIVAWLIARRPRSAQP